MSDIPTNPDRWAIRRKVIFSGLAFCAASVLLGTFAPDLEPEVRTTLITQAFWGGMGIIMAYAFAATWDDKGRP